MKKVKKLISAIKWMVILTRTPLRVSFVGGGTDIPAYYTQRRGTVIATSLGYFIDIILCKPSRSSYIFEISCGTSHQVANEIAQIEHPLIRESLKLIGINQPLRISSFSNIPSGMGLGASSTFIVGLLHALYVYSGRNVHWQQLAQDAFHIEAEILRQPIGRQDHNIAAHGGLCHLFFNADHTVQAERISCSPQTIANLESDLMLFRIGQPRKASDILKTIDPQSCTFQYHLLKQLSRLCEYFRTELEEGKNLKNIGEILHAAWLIKRNLSSAVSNSEIDQMYALSLRNGAVGGKLLGAGGSGFLLLYVSSSKQYNIRRCLSSYQEIPFRFYMKGSTLITRK